MSNSLPRNRYRKLLLGITLALFAGLAAQAQYTGQAKTSRMRAVGILTIDAKGTARLFPVTLYTDGKYYDAGLYQASPVPLAIAGDIVYQVQKNGDPQGNFTIQNVVHSPTQWWAIGNWRPAAAPGEKAAKPSKPRAEVDPDRPVLRRPAPAASASTASADSHSPSTTDTATEKIAEQDPNRPTLRRGKPEHEQQADLPSAALSGAKTTVVAASPAASSADKTLLAVADAGNIESHPYDYRWPDEERQRDLASLQEIAVAAIAKQVKSRPNLRGVDSKSLSAIEVSALDPDNSKRPIEILTATVTPAPGKGWLPSGAAAAPPSVTIALVARKDGQGRLNQIFVEISDPLMLDVRPALHFVGAVDADGSGRAQLLFRELVDINSFVYVLYRPTPYELIKTFESKAAER